MYNNILYYFKSIFSHFHQLACCEYSINSVKITHFTIYHNKKTIYNNFSDNSLYNEIITLQVIFRNTIPLINCY